MPFVATASHPPTRSPESLPRRLPSPPLRYLMARRFPPFLLLFATLAAPAASRAAQPGSLPEQSPFLPPPAAAAPAPIDNAAGYQLSGMTVVGRDTLLSITREADKRSTWIPVGKTLGEVTVVRYDAAHDQAVIRVAGREHTLTMRQPTIVSAPAAVTPLIPAPSVAATPPVAPGADPATVPAPVVMPPLSAQEEKEMEARMLVTDLLEIGQRQRQAYAEAQRQAAEKAAAAARSSASK